MAVLDKVSYISVWRSPFSMEVKDLKTEPLSMCLTALNVKA